MNASELGMLHTGTLSPSRSDRRLTVLLTIFFLAPLFTAAIPKLTWLFVVILAVALILSVVRRIDDWRQLILPNPALISFLLLAVYIGLTATWAAASGPAFGKAALFLAMTLITSRQTMLSPDLTTAMCMEPQSLSSLAPLWARSLCFLNC